MSKVVAGQRYGRWVILYELESGPNWARRWLCRCDCGAEKAVYQNGLLAGKTRGCTKCHSADTLEQRVLPTRTHGRSSTPEYRALESMVRRCTKPSDTSYPNYGGRGISVCKEWLGPGGFEAFFSYLGPKPSALHSVDRINNDGNYEPGNVRWATRKDQARNTRSNTRLTLNGSDLTLSEWSERTGISQHTLVNRIKSGWPIEKVLMLLPDKRNRPKGR